MRLIDADALKKCVLKWLPQDPCGKEEKEFPFETDICVSMLMEIDEQPTITPEPHWIPVTERLPERGKDVLVTRDYDGRMDCIKSCRYVEVACCYGEDDNAVWSAFSDEYKMIPSMHKVVAWMPLPEPYKGVTE